MRAGVKVAILKREDSLVYKKAGNAGQKIWVEHKLFLTPKRYNSV